VIGSRQEEKQTGLPLFILSNSGGASTVWMPHWGLSRVPFAELDSPYVSLPSHDKAVARLVFAVETSQRWTVLAGPSGLGKTVVVRRALAQTSSPRRRFALVSCPADGTLLLTLLAERLGQRVGREPSRLAAWRALERAVRLATLTSFQVVIVIDDCDDRIDETTRRELDSLARLGSLGSASLTIIQVETTGAECLPIAHGAWSLTVGLEPMTRSQAEGYLVTKLEQAGSSERVFTPRAITRLHALSLGVPGGLEHLASRCLMAGAVRGLEVIHPDVVDTVAGELWPDLLALSS
jgi:type II secretory pathway predicted ATPase ExeA